MSRLLLLGIGLIASCTLAAEKGRLASMPLGTPAKPTADQLLAQVRDALPIEPVSITAELQSKDRHGHREAHWLVDMRLEWGAPVPQAEYIISDAFGKELQRLVITRPHHEAANFTLTTAHLPSEALAKEGPSPRSLTNIWEQVEGTDFTWADLSFDFLWWTGGQTVGMQKRKKRFCWVVDIPAPEQYARSYSGIRLWIDSEMHFPLMAEVFDHEHQRVRLIDIKRLRRLGENRWTVGVIEVRSYPSKHKTMLRVRRVETEL